MGQRAFRGDEMSADALSLCNLKCDLCKRKLFKVEIITNVCNQNKTENLQCAAGLINYRHFQTLLSHTYSYSIEFSKVVCDVFSPTFRMLFRMSK